MKTLIILALSCISGIAQEIGIQSVSSVATNAESGDIRVTDTFTRGGQTNLIRITVSKGSAVVFRFHQFCHHGEPVASFSWRDGLQSFHTYPGTPYSANLEFSPSKDVRCVMLQGRGWFDGFYNTNGIYYPAPDSDLEMKDLKDVK